MRRWSDPENRLWLVPAIAVKVVLALYLSWHASRMAGGPYRIYQVATDTRSYLDPVENLFAKGIYIVDLDNPASAAGRMPAYGATYAVFRLVASPDNARSLLTVLQVLLSGVSVYYLALCAWLVFRRRDVFFATFALYASCLFVSIWDTFLLTESLAAAALIFFLYSLLRFQNDCRRSRLIHASFWYAYMVFLRPYAGPLYLTAVPLVWLTNCDPTRRWRVTAVRLALVASVFVAADLSWIVRNYSMLGAVIPLQINMVAGYREPPGYMALRAWLQALGEHRAYWHADTLMSWFYKSSFANEQYQVPTYALTSRCSLDDIRRAREQFVYGQRATDPGARTEVESQVSATLARCRESFLEERPFQYHVLSPLRATRTFFVHAGPVLPFPVFAQIRRDPVRLPFKLVAVALYWLVLVSGLFGIVFLVPRCEPVAWTVLTPFFFIVVLFCLFLRSPDARMLTLGFPSLTMAAALTISTVARRVARGDRAQHGAEHRPPATLRA